MPSPPVREGLYDPRFERDACGVGFIAHLKGIKSHAIVRDGLQILANLQHRGACGCDQDTGDGAGILLQMPDSFFRSKADDLRVHLPEVGAYGVAFVFLPKERTLRQKCVAALEQMVAEEGQAVLGWRQVPVVSDSIGWLARSQEPAMQQLLIGRSYSIGNDQQFERILYVIRRCAEIWATQNLTNPLSFYIASCSARTIVYKGMLKADQLTGYFPDLSDPTMTSGLAIVHSRYSTNTFPQWCWPSLSECWRTTAKSIRCKATPAGSKRGSPR